jgi:pimeloyl-ACP methyl ester carboxylesterase
MDDLIQLASGRTRIRRTGEGTPLLWTHALFHPIDVEEETPLGAMLAKITGHHVVRYDTRGQGGSARGPDDESHKWDRLGRDLSALAHALDIRSAVLGGASMGAVASVYAALEGAIEVTRLVLVIPPTAWTTRPKQADMYRAILKLLERVGMRAVVQTFEQYLSDKTVVPGFEGAREAVLENIRRFDPTTLAMILRASAASDLPPPETLSRLSMPALIIAVEEDLGHPRSTADTLARVLPKAELEVWPRIASDLLSTRIQRFLDGP